MTKRYRAMDLLPEPLVMWGGPSNPEMVNGLQKNHGKSTIFNGQINYTWGKRSFT